MTKRYLTGYEAVAIRRILDSVTGVSMREEILALLDERKYFIGLIGRMLNGGYSVQFTAWDEAEDCLNAQIVKGQGEGETP